MDLGLVSKLFYISLLFNIKLVCSYYSLPALIDNMDNTSWLNTFSISKFDLYFVNIML